MPNAREKLENDVAYLLAKKALKINHERPFTLASGAKSAYYVDCKMFFASTTARHTLTDLLEQRYQGLLMVASAIGGMELGAYPFAICLSDVSWGFPQLPDLHAFAIRKHSKDHGMQQRFAGFDPVQFLKETRRSGERQVLIVEDVTTTGHSALDAVQVCRAAGLPVHHVLTLVDRQEHGVQALLESHGLTFHRVFTLADLLPFAEQ